jgi:hypothetical protein
MSASTIPCRPRAGRLRPKRLPPPRYPVGAGPARSGRRFLAK